MNEITELADAIRRERPKPDREMAEALVDLIEAILIPATVDVEVAVDRYVAKLNAHIDRRVGRYMRGAGEIAP